MFSSLFDLYTTFSVIYLTGRLLYKKYDIVNEVKETFDYVKENAIKCYLKYKKKDIKQDFEITHFEVVKRIDSISSPDSDSNGDNNSEDSFISLYMTEEFKQAVQDPEFVNCKTMKDLLSMKYFSEIKKDELERLTLFCRVEFYYNQNIYYIIYQDYNDLQTDFCWPPKIDKYFMSIGKEFITEAKVVSSDNKIHTVTDMVVKYRGPNMDFLTNSGSRPSCKTILNQTMSSEDVYYFKDPKLVIQTTQGNTYTFDYNEDELVIM